MAKKGLIIIILILLLLVSNLPDIKSITGYAIKQQQTNNFSTYTKAVCDKIENKISCEDRLFVICNGVEQQIEMPNGKANFSLGWNDTRQ